MADTQTKRSRPLAQPKRRQLDYRRKKHLYEAVYDLNRILFVAIEVFERLERQEFFRRDSLRAFRNMAEELLARANYELTETLHDQEQRESAHFGRLRLKWERRFSDPNDTKIPKRRPGKQPC